MPGVLPVTTPVNEPTVAMVVLLLVHVPPPTVLLNVVVCPTHALRMPVMIPGALFTVTRRVALQPAVPVKVIIDVPVVNPVTIPELRPTVATPVVPLTQVPLPVALSVVVVPTHNPVAPLIVGAPFTLIVRTA